MRPAANFLKGLIVIFGFLGWLDNIGFDIATLLAGLGIGGIAIALALQKPMEDFFGAISLFTQQPIWCRWKTRNRNNIARECINMRPTRERITDV